MLDLKSTVARLRVRFPLLNSIRRWKAERHICGALHLHLANRFTDPSSGDQSQPCHSDFGLRGIGFVPHAEMAAWRCRFYAATVVYLLVLVVCCLYRGGSL